MTKVPIYNTNTYSPKYTRKKQKLEQIRNQYSDEWRYALSTKTINGRLTEINKQIMALKVEKAELRAVVKKRQQLVKEGRAVTVKLYALRLEHGYWYVGMSYNVQNRFRQHVNGKGAAWNTHHKPLEIHEVRDTGVYDQDSVANLEDDMTLEYALKYGSTYVRGGGWCQSKPRWPAVIVENELSPTNLEVV